MALPVAAAERTLKHRRSIDVGIYSRGDGIWEVDAHISDTKTHDIPLGGGVRRAGEPIHDMLLRLVIDEQMNILSAGAQTRWMPYAGQCDDHGDAYERLAGLNLLKGFRRSVTERLGGIQGCTHITELAQLLPTAVIQAFAGDVLDTREGSDAHTPPFQINRCHALRDDGDVVREHYPRWYRPAPGDADSPGL